ncbi:MAG: hypothetical protein ACYTEQ_17830 [Planctomycetota bacterium]|jgi:acyl-[acyl carrier protein]--UDP-N-acetylglucosamine O-acyltransferase
MISVGNDAVADTRAGIGSNVDIGQSSGIVNNVSVSTDSTIYAHAEVFALSAGIGAFSVNYAFVDITPEVEAYIASSSNIEVSGDISVTATATPKAYAETFGVNAGALAVGASSFS